jgi:hypothetical protein
MSRIFVPRLSRETRLKHHIAGVLVPRDQVSEDIESILNYMLETLQAQLQSSNQQ